MYLEAPLSGTRSQAADGSLIIMAAGNQKLYEAASSCLQALSSKCYYLGMYKSSSLLALINLFYSHPKSIVLIVH